MARGQGLVDGSNHQRGGAGGIFGRRFLAAAAAVSEVFDILEGFCGGSLYKLGHHLC